MSYLKKISKNVVEFTLSLPRGVKRLVVFLVDTFLCLLAVYLSLYLRLGEWVDITAEPYRETFISASLLSLTLSLPIFFFTGLYRAIFRYSGLPALLTIAKAVLIYSIAYVVICTFVGVPSIPRTIGVIQPVLLLVLIGVSRIIAGGWLGGAYLHRLRTAELPKVLIYGAGSAGQQLALALSSSYEMKVVGFLDDDPSMSGQIMHGLKIYPADKASRIVAFLGVSDILLAIPSINRARRNALLEKLLHLKVRLRTLPGLVDLAQGRITSSDLRELDIDDLLGREAVEPDIELLAKNITGKCIMITGAGGSIGGEICRQVLKLNPTHLLLVEHSEPALYQIEQELEIKIAAEELLTSQVVPLLASVTDERAIETILSSYNPSTIYHAAAYKHVPLVESNPFSGVKNNVFGTLTLAKAAIKAKTKCFVLISTDKAVRPTNVMGASKRLAEMILQGLAETTSSTIFTMVRFGNVLASSGSVIPKFRQQIKDGGPVTVTDFRMTRFFMTIPEAAQLVIQAGAIAKGSEVFLLDMGKPVKIYDLAKRMIELSGLEVKDISNLDGDIEIAEVGIRPGEKLYEELLISGDAMKTAHPKIFKSNENFVKWDELNEQLNLISHSVGASDIFSLNSLLQKLVEGYKV